MAKAAVPGQGHRCHKSLAANRPGRNSPSHHSRPFHFYRHNSTVSTKREMGASRLGVQPQYWMGCQSSLAAGCSNGDSATLVPLNISCYLRLLTNSQLGQGGPGIYGRDFAFVLSSPPAAQSSHANRDTVSLIELIL